MRLHSQGVPASTRAPRAALLSSKPVPGFPGLLRPTAAGETSRGAKRRARSAGVPRNREVVVVQRLIQFEAVSVAGNKTAPDDEMALVPDIVNSETNPVAFKSIRVRFGLD